MASNHDLRQMEQCNYSSVHQSSRARHFDSTSVSQFPLERLPVDILREVFLHYAEGGNIPEVLFHNICYSKHSDADPRILELVCKRWKTTAQSHTHLWSSIFISNPNRKDVAIVRSWLEKASRTSLSLYLHQSSRINANDEPGNSAQPVSVAQELLSLFTTRFQYWKNIDFHVHDGSAFNDVPDLFLFSPPPYLRRAAIELKNRNNITLTKLWNVLHASPSLRAVSWYDSYTTEPSFHSRIPWMQLTDISLHSNISVDDLLDIISLSTHLKAISVFSLKGEAPPRRPIIAHPTLHKILIQASSINLDPLFTHLLLPSLDHIHIGHTQPPSPSRGGPAFANLVARSNCALRVLSIRDAGMSQAQLREFLPFPLLPAVCELAILGMEDISDETIQLLTRYRRRPFQQDADECGQVDSVLPLLTSLSLETCATSGSTLSDMIESRLSPAPELAALRSVVLEMRNGSESEMRRLQSFAAAYGEELQMMVSNVCYDPLA